MGEKRSRNMKYKQVKKTQQSIDAFFAEIEELQASIGELSEKVNVLQRTQSEILTIPEKKKETSSHLDEELAIIRNKSVKIRTKLKELEESTAEKENNKSLSSADLRIRKTQYNGMVRKFLDIMERYSESQLEFREQCRNRIVKEMEIATGKRASDLDPAEIELMIESDNPQVFTQMIIKDTEEAKAALADIEARRNDITKLEQGIQEIQHMFTELGTIVIEQGEQVDNIQWHIEQADVVVKRGNEQAEEAAKKKRATRKMKLGCAVAVGVIVIIVIIAIALSV